MMGRKNKKQERKIRMSILKKVSSRVYIDFWEKDSINEYKSDFRMQAFIKKLKDNAKIDGIKKIVVGYYIQRDTIGIDIVNVDSTGKEYADKFSIHKLYVKDYRLDLYTVMVTKQMHEYY